LLSRFSMSLPRFHLLSRVKRLFRSFLDNRLYRTIKVFHKSRLLFQVFDYGSITRYRARTFSSKEPETLAWIDNFSQSDVFFDVGANVGMYSLYAASKGLKVLSFEPDALNFAILNLNIYCNKFSNLITAYSIPLHYKDCLSTFNTSMLWWGSALNSFENSLDAWGQEYLPEHSFGSYSLPLDRIVFLLGIQPSHLKIDVDGNEFLVLKGSSAVLKSRTLRSILVELDMSSPSYKIIIDFILSFGFSLSTVTRSSHNSPAHPDTIANHIFLRTTPDTISPPN
jgi:FkbM family methyltransferase